MIDGRLAASSGSCLRHLVNQEGITLLMATLGITYFLEGSGQALFGNDIYKIDVGMPKDHVFIFEQTFQGGLLINKEDLYAAVDISRGAGGRCSRSSSRRRPSIGRALRAVADDYQAAQSIGIPLGGASGSSSGRSSPATRRAGRHGVIWGSKLGVQYSISLVALKAFPVVILGGLTSVPGAILGGLIIGVGEKLSEIYIGPMLGGGIEIWFAYVLALVFLLVRPEGLFGEKIIDLRLDQGPAWIRLRRSAAGAPSGGSDRRERGGMLYRENGQFKSSYRADQQIFPILQDRIAIGLLLLAAFVVDSADRVDPTCCARS